MKLAIQLYSVRNELAKDFAGTLAALQKIGFTGVELAFFYGGLRAAALAELLDRCQLTTCGIYEQAQNLQNKDSEVYEYARLLNCHYLTMGFSPAALKSDFEGCLELLKRVVATASGHACQVCYHAHAHEFEKLSGASYLEQILSRTEGLLYEADTAWIHAGGEAVIQHLRQYARRIPLLHLKDLTAAGEITELGHGVIDFAEVCRTAAEIGIRTVSYEQDSSSIGALKSAEISYQHVRPLLG